MIVLILGLVWGFIEATLGGVLHLARFYMTGEILGSIGMCVMFYGLRKGVKPSKLLMIPVIAAGIKFIDAPLFNLPFLAPTIVRPAAAILMQGLAFVSLSHFIKKAKRVELLGYTAVLCAVPIVAFFNLFNTEMAALYIQRILFMTVCTYALFNLVLFAREERKVVNFNTAIASSTLLIALTLLAKAFYH